MDHQRKNRYHGLQSFLPSLESVTFKKKIKGIFIISWKNTKLRHMLGGIHGGF